MQPAWLRFFFALLGRDLLSANNRGQIHPKYSKDAQILTWAIVWAPCQVPRVQSKDGTATDLHPKRGRVRGLGGRQTELRLSRVLPVEASFLRDVSLEDVKFLTQIDGLSVVQYSRSNTSFFRTQRPPRRPCLFSQRRCMACRTPFTRPLRRSTRYDCMLVTSRLRPKLSADALFVLSSHSKCRMRSHRRADFLAVKSLTRSTVPRSRVRRKVRTSQGSPAVRPCHTSDGRILSLLPSRIQTEPPFQLTWEEWEYGNSPRLCGLVGSSVSQSFSRPAFDGFRRLLPGSSWTWVSWLDYPTLRKQASIGHPLEVLGRCW